MRGEIVLLFFFAAVACAGELWPAAEPDLVEAGFAEASFAVPRVDEGFVGEAFVAADCCAAAPAESGLCAAAGAAADPTGLAVCTEETVEAEVVSCV
jgi:hypothetical protein